MLDILSPETWSKPQFSLREAALYTNLSERTVRSYLERQNVPVGTKLPVTGWTFSYSDVAILVIVREISRRASLPVAEAAKIAVLSSELCIKLIQKMEFTEVIGVNFAAIWDDARNIRVVLDDEAPADKVRLLIPAGALMFDVWQIILHDKDPIALLVFSLNIGWNATRATPSEE